MKKVLFCLKMPRGTYVGGVATIIHHYFDNRDIFEKYEYGIELFDYAMSDRFKKLPSKFRELVYSILQKRNLRRYLKRESADIVHIHTSREWLFLKDVLLAKKISQKHGVKTVFTIHVGDVNTVFRRIHWLQNFLIKILNRHVEKTMFLSKAIQQQFIDLGVDKAKTEVLYNPHYMQPVSDREMLPRSAKLHLLYVGALHREKGLMELLQALDELPQMDFHLDICGLHTDPSIMSEFEEYIEKLGDKVAVHGYVSGSTKTAFFERADVLLLPSYHEGMPLVVLEALASACAIVSTKVGTTPEILSDENVLWVDIGSSHDIQIAVETLYQNHELLADIKKNNLLLSQKYDIETHIKNLCEIYESVTNAYEENDRTTGKN